MITHFDYFSSRPFKFISPTSNGSLVSCYDWILSLIFIQTYFWNRTNFFLNSWSNNFPKSQVTLGQGNLSKLYLVASSLIVLWYLERKKCSQWQQIKTWNLERMDPLKWLNSWVPKQTITCFSMLKQFFGIISIIEWLSLLSRVLFIPSKVGKHSDPLSPDQVKMRDL